MIIYMNLYKTKCFLENWKLWFSCINEKKVKKIKRIKISARFGQFSISSWREKGHEPSRAEPSWISFSSSSGSSQVGSDSSLLIWYHSGPSLNQFLSLAFFYCFLQKDCSRDFQNKEMLRNKLELKLKSTQHFVL